MKKLQKGFTLIELMIVVAIIAILAAVAAPKFGAQLKKAKDAKGVEVASVWSDGHRSFYSDQTIYATNMGQIVTYVDTNTTDMTWTANGAAKIGTPTTATGGAVQVGSGVLNSTDSKSYANFAIVGTATESSVQFIDTTVTDTKGTTWSAIKI